MNDLQNEYLNPGSDQPASSERTMSIALAVVGVFVTYVPITAVSAVLPTIGAATRASTSDLQWVSDAYVIPMAAAVLSAGAFGDRHGRKRVYVGGMVLTILGALVAGLANTLTHNAVLYLLWAGQAISGLGAGMLLPTTLALIGHAVPEPDQRGKFIGIWATGLTFGLALGPLIAGLILEDASWGWTFVPTALLAGGAAVLAVARLPESRAPEPRTMDWAGQLTATVTIASSIYGTIAGGESGWASAGSISAYIVAVVGFVAFVFAERRSSSPLVDFGLFKSLPFTVAGLAALLTLFSVVGTMFLLSLYLGYVQHLSALQIGVRLLFVTGIATLANPVIGVLLHRMNALLVLAAGLMVAAVGIFLLVGVGADTGLASLAWRLAIFGVALSVVLTSVSTAAINAAPWQLAGMAAAINTALRQYGGALGPAVLGVIFSHQVNNGSTPTAALHAALAIDAALLAAAAGGCLLAARRSSRSTS